MITYIPVISILHRRESVKVDSALVESVVLIVNQVVGFYVSDAPIYNGNGPMSSSNRVGNISISPCGDDFSSPVEAVPPFRLFLLSHKKNQIRTVPNQEMN
jgi:hypothetical protein